MRVSLLTSKQGLFCLFLFSVIGLLCLILHSPDMDSFDSPKKVDDGVLLRVLDQSHVHLGKDVTIETLIGSIEAIKTQGHQNFIVVSDFDLTLTKGSVNGKPGLTSYCVVDQSPLMPESYRKEALELRELYAAKEHDHSLPVELRIQAMEDWHTEANDLLLKYQLNKSSLKEIVSKANVKLRSGFRALTDLSTKHEVPFLIFSAGLQDTIKEIIIQQNGELASNVHIVSNKLIYDSHGVAVDYETPIIHSYKKGAIPVRFEEVTTAIRGRHNVLLLGDSLTDVQMPSGLEKVDHLIKIGYLNNHDSEQLVKYREHYDIVLTEDRGLDVPSIVLNSILTP